MSTASYNCPCCGGPLKFSGESGRLECAACGNSYEPEALEMLNASESGEQISFEHPKEGFRAEEGVQAYLCKNCGAELITEDTTTAAECPYCGSPTILPDRIEGGVKPEKVIPFVVTKEQAQKQFEDYFKGKRLLPNIFLNGRNRISEMRRLYRETFDAVQHLTAIRIAHYHPNRDASGRYPFSGILRCDQCGSYYRRKIASAGTPYSKPVWICTTYNMKGKKYCASKQIPESILLQTTASVLGLEEFDDETFAAAIEHIHVTGPNSLRYIFRDGQEREVVWQDHSRRDSWTDDMRMQAAAHARRRYDHE